MKVEDFQQMACSCEACILAGVSTLVQIRDRDTGRWLHGRELRRWHEARDAFWKRFHEQTKTRAMK